MTRQFSSTPYRGGQQYPKDINRLITSLFPSGRIIFQEDFELNFSKLAYERGAGSTGGGLTVASTLKPLSGQYYGALQSPVENAAISEAWTFFGMFPNLKVGFELGFALPNESLNLIKLSINHCDGAYQWWADPYYIPNQHQWKLVSPDQVIFAQDLCDGLYATGSDLLCWHRAKLIADFSTHKLVSFCCNDRSVDLRTIDIRREVYVADVDTISIHVWVQNATPAVQTYCYLDDILVTIEE